MSGASGGLNQKRVLVTDIETDFGKEIANAVVAEGALVFVLVKEPRAMQQVLETCPQLTPVLLDIAKEKEEEQARKLIRSLPTLDHIVNLSGDTPFNILSQAYPNAKIQEVSDAKAKPIVAKMGEPGGKSCIFHAKLFGNQNIMSKLKANLDPRFTNSKTAQFSTNLRQSLKKMFNSSGETNSQTQSSSSSSQVSTTTMTTTRTEEVIVRETHAATSFAAVATTLNQKEAESAGTSNSNGNNANGHSSSNNGSGGSTTTTTRTPNTRSQAPNSRTQSLQEKNSKVREAVLKLQKTCAKKWRKNEKRIAKEQQHQLKALQKEIEKSKKIEKANIMKSVSEANASTMERQESLSADTARRIQEAREKRADKEVEKHAQKKLETDTAKILENSTAQLQEYHEKLYKKMVDREITEFNRIKSKYLV